MQKKVYNSYQDDEMEDCTAFKPYKTIGMCTFIKMEYLVANALVELYENKKIDKISLDDIKNYGIKVEKVLNKTEGTQAILLYSNQYTREFLQDYSDYFVFEDDYIIVANKGYGLLSVSSDRIKERTAFHILSDYLKEDDPSAKLFVIHRLDRDTSGLIMFAKSEEVQFKLQRSWNEMVLDRRYVAVISGHIDPAEGEISSYLTENSVHHVYSTPDKEKGQFALTKYKTLQKNSRLSLVELQLATGRKNQIRVHMSESGHPIAGDKRYGSKENPLGRLSLHAFRLRFVHPITRQDMLFETPLPPQFVKVTR